MAAENASTVVGGVGTSTNSAITTARARIDQAEQPALAYLPLSMTSAVRADDVEQPDQRDNRAAHAPDADVTQVGRQVHGDEGDVEAANEEAGGQQAIAAVCERMPQGR